MKKVEFGSSRPSAGQDRTVDAWVQGVEVVAREPTKRLTIDVSLSLHKRIKSQCAIADLVMADEIRDLLEQRFPAPNDGTGRAS